MSFINIFSTLQAEKTGLNVLFLSLNILYGIVFSHVYAEDSISIILQRMGSDTVVKISYQEIRTLELMEQPWLGEGFMYSLAPDLMIKEQLKPQRLLMAVKGDKMFYFDPENNIRHQGVIDSESSLTLNMAVFKALMNADIALLNRIYHVSLSNTQKRWVMTLTPKQAVEKGFNTVISGLSEQPVDTIIVNQADGDVSEFTLGDSQTGIIIKKAINRLYLELIGE